ncbi:MAG: ECF-type sigma factor [Pseudomonadota bacterium]
MNRPERFGSVAGGTTIATDPSKNVTNLLVDWRAGDANALSQLAPLIYGERRKLAGHYRRGERAAHTLQPTALVNKAFEHLLDADVAWQNRAHFYAVTATQMRRILVDHAKRRRSLKRGAGAPHVSLTQIELANEDMGIDLLALNAALEELEALNPARSQLIKLQYFAGLSQRGIASITNQSKTQVHRDVSFARAWLCHKLQE